MESFFYLCYVRYSIGKDALSYIGYIQVDEIWFRGSTGGKTGIFPGTFVEILVPLPAAPPAVIPTPPDKPAKAPKTSAGTILLAALVVFVRRGKRRCFSAYSVSSCSYCLQCITGKTCGAT